MKFEFDGREFDTDKPIYVLGYEIKNYWHPLRPDCDLRAGFYPVKCKKTYVADLQFFYSTVDKKNIIYSMKFYTKGYSFIHCDYDRNRVFIGHSPSECKKIFEQWRKENEANH